MPTDQTLEQKIATVLDDTMVVMGDKDRIVSEIAKVAREHYHDTAAHIVVVTYRGRTDQWEWNLQHPLTCREGGVTSLVECEVNQRLIDEGPIGRSGTFEVRFLDDGELDFTRVDGV